MKIFNIHSDVIQHIGTPDPDELLEKNGQMLQYVAMESATLKQENVKLKDLIAQQTMQSAMDSMKLKQLEAQIKELSGGEK